MRKLDFYPPRPVFFVAFFLSLTILFLTSILIISLLDEQSSTGSFVSVIPLHDYVLLDEQSSTGSDMYISFKQKRGFFGLKILIITNIIGRLAYFKFVIASKDWKWKCLLKRLVEYISEYALIDALLLIFIHNKATLKHVFL